MNIKVKLGGSKVLKLYECKLFVFCNLLFLYLESYFAGTSTTASLVFTYITDYIYLQLSLLFYGMYGYLLDTLRLFCLMLFYCFPELYLLFRLCNFEYVYLLYFENYTIMWYIIGLLHVVHLFFCDSNFLQTCQKHVCMFVFRYKQWSSGQQRQS